MANFSAGDRVPDVNDLVRVIIGTVDDRDEEISPDDVPSRVEDVVLSGSRVPTHYLIAAPWFSGDLELPRVETECLLQWVTPRGLCMLPVAFLGQETTASGLRVWRMQVIGPPHREERRRYVRVDWRLATTLEVRRDLAALPLEQRQRLDTNETHQTLAELPDTLEAMTLNISEGGLRCFTAPPALPAHLPILVTFALDQHKFTIPAHIVWSLLRNRAGQKEVESAVEFDEQTRYSERLRPLLFQAQLRARRASLE